METPTINAKKRDRLGTRYARRLRSTGQVPGVLYGHKKETVALAVDERDMMSCLQQGSRLVTVDIEGQPETCLVKDFQFDHLGTEIIHIDFSRVNLAERVEVTVSLQFVGEAVGLKAPGAVFRTVIDSVTIRCTAGSIPAVLPVDVTALDTGDYLSAGEIELPEGSLLVTDAAGVVCRITMIQEAEEEGEATEVEGDDATAEAGDDDSSGDGDS